MIGVGLVRRSADSLLSARCRAQRLARAPPLGQEPEHRDEREQHGDELALLRVLPEQPEAVEAEERPRLWAQQRGTEDERERLPALAVEVALEGEQHQRDQDALGVPEHRVAQEVGRQQQPGVRGDARRGARPAAADDPARHPEDHHDGQQPARAGDQQPEVGAASPNGANSVVKNTGSGFHDGPVSVLRSRWMILATPLDPRTTGRSSESTGRAARAPASASAAAIAITKPFAEIVRRASAALLPTRGARAGARSPRPSLRSRGGGRPRWGWGRRWWCSFRSALQPSAEGDIRARKQR